MRFIHQYNSPSCNLNRIFIKNASHNFCLWECLAIYLLSFPTTCKSRAFTIMGIWATHIRTLLTRSSLKFCQNLISLGVDTYNSAILLKYFYLFWLSISFKSMITPSFSLSVYLLRFNNYLTNFILFISKSKTVTTLIFNINYPLLWSSNTC